MTVPIILARAALFAHLAPLNVPVKFAGETLPTSGAHVVITIIADTPEETLDAEEHSSTLRVQLDFWTTESSLKAAQLAQMAKGILHQHGWERTGASVPLGKDGDWHRVSHDYRTLIQGE
ncbi:tail completion protein gp17 [Deinococcus peraridilitoris]|uniref:DUF3168 domain-containing protein n=1 Tax=Deinococcus peraridilitoris (strain DSM 19664 / LMG 22246 / CIP 109416 / KR-200) TaxID=937777 RepID=K9ZYS2_DEIPD|nr:hypothetical protein [Deinococcus peraridilitoris]AFZ66067.1 hypothetical protein Deipe_0471 [Deinococcus peraridilitoris DSM 19664]